ncbi:Glycosyl transferase family 2 [Rhizobium sp. RU20A]|uniref:glycosyltransferase family 2 protein n=1 Tax=Rhizobium sp. RU20A TaxID=1907412 RepID=UPI000954B967|nr:glycosyltransferase [Rhizobium sp. RU20A]SIQ60141.1 Glycosyl transferase family 2 [Rhizobium sp. RU20A]
MTATPTLTICVPSRNRQYTFKETIRSLVMSPRLDVHFVFADNSDDPSIMNDFMKDVIGDPRVTYLPTDDRIHPMSGNWERCVEAARGDFICVIGDDDYVDPDVAGLISDLCAKEKDVDVVVWGRLSFNWPDNRFAPCSVAVPLGTKVFEVPRVHLFEEFFGWKVHDATPNCPFSIYHGAVSRRAMEANKRRFGGRHFGHITVDFETSCKLVVNARRFFYVERPFSVLGACFASNSGGVGNPEELKRRHANAMAELGRNIDEDPYMKNFPFGCILGVAAAVGQVQEWFCTTFGIKRPKGWEANFADACALDCNRSGSQQAFDLIVEGYLRGLRLWKGGEYVKYFNPVFKERSAGLVYFGMNEKNLHIDENVADVQTPAELYRIVSQVMVPIAELKKTNSKKKVA